MTYKTTVVQFGDEKFKVEIADTFRKVATGLMNHKSMEKDAGMLFIFRSDGKHGFWMLNMKFSIDMIWMDKDGKVVHIVNNAQPCESIFNCKTERPPVNARYVLELYSGTAKRLGLKLGDKFKLQL